MYRDRPSIRERFIGCILGGACGDALGAPVEFMSQQEILCLFGDKGINELIPAYGRLGAITDDTQMTLFTAEGLIRGWVRGMQRGITTYPGVVANAYLRWLYTQGESPLQQDFQHTRRCHDGWLIRHRQLHRRRSPGATCLSALRYMSSLDEPAENNSKGCGGLMRIAPAGLFGWQMRDYMSHQDVFDLGSDLAAITHGHPTGRLTAGVLSLIIMQLVDGRSLKEALRLAKKCLVTKQDHEETLFAIEQAEALAGSSLLLPEVINELGEGWVAEEALSISVYCALTADSFRHGVTQSVNHGGDSDSTGAITDNILGAMLGINVIPESWLKPLELRDVIEEIATDLYLFPRWDIGEYSDNTELVEAVFRKYPGD